MKRGLKRFAKYSVIGVGTLFLDLGMLFVAVHYFDIPYFVATPFTYLVAVSCNYAISRRAVFARTERAWHHGYGYFLVLGLAGAVVTTSLVTALVALFGIYYLTARILVAGVVGLANYLFNLYFNFRVAGKH